MRTESSFYHTDAIREVDAAFLSLIAHGYDDSVWTILSTTAIVKNVGG